MESQPASGSESSGSSTSSDIPPESDSGRRRPAHPPRPARPARPCFLLLASIALLISNAPTAAQSTSPSDDDPEEVFLAAMRGDAYRVTGLLQLLGNAADTPDPVHTPHAFNLAHARLGLRTQLDSPFNAVFQLNFAGEPNLLDAYLSWTPDAALQIRAGSFKPVQNLDLAFSPGQADFIGRSITSKHVIANREIGISASWRRGWLGVHGSLVNGDRTSATPDNRYLTIGRMEIDHRTESAEGLAARFRAGLFGNSGLSRSTPLGISKRIVAKGRRKVIGADARMEVGPWMVAGEWMEGEVQTSPGVRTRVKGGYATAGWSPDSRTQLLARYQSLQTESGPPALDERQATLALKRSLTRLAAVWLNGSAWLDGAGKVEELGLSVNLQFMF